MMGQFGDAVEVSSHFNWEWLAIPHLFRVPFYVYAYSFGQLLVLSLYQQYRQEGKAFKPRYLDLLSAGGSDASVRILERAGADIRSPEFWNGGFVILGEFVRRLESVGLPE
jgi:oligoendopeptidase F